MPRSWSGVVGRALRFISWAMMGGVLTLTAAWALGRVLTDTHQWSQYLFWMPTVIVVGVGLGAGMLAAGARWISGALSVASRRAALWGEGEAAYAEAERKAAPAPAWRLHAFRVFFGVAMLGVAGAGVHALFEWSGPGRAAGFQRAESFRVAFWNDSEGLMRNWEEALLAPGADLAIMKPGSGRTFGRVLEAMGPDADFVYTHGFAVVSKAKILRRTAFTLGVRQNLGLDPRRSNFKQRQADYGTAMILELGTRERLGKNITLCLIDLPSDISLWRQDVMADAKAALEKSIGDVWRKDEALDRWVRIENPEAFAEADVMLGDFNTPPGAGSLKTLTGELASAYDQAGDGYSATFPRVLPLWHLDQVYIGPGLRAAWYQVRDPGGGTHAMQVVDLVRAGGSGEVTK